MYAKILAEHVRAYLNLQAFLDERRADGVDTERASRAVEQARRQLLDALNGPESSEIGPLPAAIRAYLEAEHEFDKCSVAGADLNAPARRMEGTRRDLQWQLGQILEEDVPEVRVRRVAAKPMRQRRILVAYDESAQAQWALEVALQMTREVAGELMLVHVVRPATGARGKYVCSLERLDTLRHREADEMLTKVRRSLPQPIQAEQMVREGLPADQILAAARAWEADLIVMGTRARGRLAQFLLGGTAETVLRRAPCPVMVVGRKLAWATQAQPSTRSEELVGAAT